MKYFLKKYIIMPTVLIFIIFSTTACLASDTTANTSTDTITDTTATNTGSDITASYSQKDLDDTWDDSTAVHISLDKTAITVDKQEGITIDGSTLTISAAGTYVLSGTLSDGQIVVDAADNDDIHLIFQNANITNSKTSPVYIKNADKTIITLPANTTNSINDSSVYSFFEGEDEPDAALFSNNDLTINGRGKLTVNGNYRNGIASKDDLVITRGMIEVIAVNDALRGRDSVAIKDGTLILTAGGDGIKANQDADSAKGYIVLDGGNYTINAQNDGIQAETILKINDGNYNITTGGGSVNATMKTSEPMGGGMYGGTPPAMKGDREPRPDMTSDTSKASTTKTATTTEIAETETTESVKGLKAGTALIVNSGSFQLDTVDDALHSNGTVSINGGDFNIATGDDGIHSDTDLIINDGSIAISKSYEGIEGATVTINGGDINIVSTDDGINAAGGNDTNTGDTFRSTGEYWIRITNGTININAGGDGIDSNGDFYQEGGNIVIESTTGRGDTPLDYDGKSTITGGTMSPNPSESQQMQGRP